jgi:hypothetical protein
MTTIPICALTLAAATTSRIRGMAAVVLSKVLNGLPTSPSSRPRQPSWFPIIRALGSVKKLFIAPPVGYWSAACYQTSSATSPALVPSGSCPSSARAAAAHEQRPLCAESPLVQANLVSPRDKAYVKMADFVCQVTSPTRKRGIHTRQRSSPSPPAKRPNVDLSKHRDKWMSEYLQG